VRRAHVAVVFIVSMRSTTHAALADGCNGAKHVLQSPALLLRFLQ
jgi:hypothetical protein